MCNIGVEIEVEEGFNQQQNSNIYSIIYKRQIINQWIVNKDINSVKFPIIIRKIVGIKMEKVKKPIL